MRFLAPRPPEDPEEALVREEMSESLKSLARRRPAFFWPLPEEFELLPASLSLSCMASKRRSRSFQSSLTPSPWLCCRWAGLGLAAEADEGMEEEEEGVVMDGSESERDMILRGTTGPPAEKSLEFVTILAPKSLDSVPVLLLLANT